MRRLFLTCPIWLGIGVVVGCGGSLPPKPLQLDPPKIGPHQGVAFPLADDLGYVEVTNEPEPERGSPSTALVVYFLDRDAKAATATPPSDVMFQVAQAKNKVQPVPLKASPKADDPAGSGRFASELGPYGLADLRGDLTATIAGKPVKITLVGGR